MPNYTNWTRTELRAAINEYTNRMATAKTDEDYAKYKAKREELIEALGEKVFGEYQRGQA